MDISEAEGGSVAITTRASDGILRDMTTRYRSVKDGQQPNSLHHLGGTSLKCLWDPGPTHVCGFALLAYPSYRRRIKVSRADKYICISTGRVYSTCTMYMATAYR